MFLGVFSLQAWEGRQAAAMEISAAHSQVFRNSFLAGGWLFCTKCTCLFSSPLPVLSRIHWDGDRGGGRAGSLPHPFYLLHHKKRKIKITFCPVLKEDLDNLTFFKLFFLNTSAWLNRTYWSGSVLNRAVDYCAPSMTTKNKKESKKTNENKKQRVHFFGKIWQRWKW